MPNEEPRRFRIGDEVTIRYMDKCIGTVRCFQGVQDTGFNELGLIIESPIPFRGHDLEGRYPDDQRGWWVSRQDAKLVTPSENRQELNDYAEFEYEEDVIEDYDDEYNPDFDDYREDCDCDLCTAERERRNA
jgi:hypothetical protein